MAKVRAQNTALRATLDSLAMARSELAIAQADIRQLSRIIEALRAHQQSSRWGYLPAPTPGGSTSRPGRSAPRLPPSDTASAMRASAPVSSCGSSHCSGAPSPLGSCSSAVDMEAEREAREKELQERELREEEVHDQLALKSSRLEALEAELEVARAQNAEWHRLMALYDRERAIAAELRQQIQQLQQEVLFPACRLFRS